MLRLNPKNGEFVEYLLPRLTNIRRVFVDNRTTPVTFWVGNNHGASIVKLEPLEAQPAPSTAAAATAPTVFDGARLIGGDGRAPIENAAIVVEGGRIVDAGPRGSLRVPAGARRVDLPARR